MTAELSTPFHTAPGEGLAVWQLGALLTFKVTSEASGGRCWAKELLAPRGMASPRHVHSQEDEAFYVLDGEVSIYVGADVIRAVPGSFVWGPRSVPHAFCVESETAKMLVFGTAPGFDRFFRDTGTPAVSHTLPAPATEAPDLNTLVAAARKHGVEVTGPPPAPSAMNA
jgi:quercetin dioxygenase-like cupin family protein